MDLTEVAAPKAKAESWTCSMHPQVKLPGPGDCPLCGMDLIPVAEGTATGQAGAPPDLETVPITYRALAREIRTVGKLDYNERHVADITARIAGRVDRLYADFTGIEVKEGDHLVDIYSPELYQAQNELVLAANAYEKARAANRSGVEESALRTVESARTRLRLWGITPEQIAAIERSRDPNTHLTIYAPIGGTVIEKSVRAGQYVKEGDLLYRIADLDPIWLYLDLYEYDMGWVRYGQSVDVTLEAYPGEAFLGTVTFIDPYLDDTTRTIKVRVNLPNHDRRLKPAMYATATIRVRLEADGSPQPTGFEGKYWCPMHPEVVRDAPGNCPICKMGLELIPEAPATRLAPGAEHAGHEQADPAPGPGQVLAIPVSAVLDTGRRTVAYRKTADGGYELVELELGPRADARGEDGRASGYYPVFKGLNAGDEVVVRGGFLLDSQRQIEGMPSLLYPGGQSAANLHAGHGGMPEPKPLEPAGHQH
jgi:Cu(I)/Ag(I) efflux system membrane fusion protein